MELFISLIPGAVAGWLGGKLFKSSGLGLIGNIMVGMVGGIIGYLLVDRNGWAGFIFTTAIAAVILLTFINLIAPRTKS